jgi:hypothetical protein
MNSVLRGKRKDMAAHDAGFFAAATAARGERRELPCVTIYYTGV